MLAARATEMKIILEEAVADLEYDGTMAPYDHTVFNKPLWNLSTPTSGRGAVRITADRWKRPTAAHDIEFRQWLDADNALDNMRFMMELVQRAEKLRDTSSFTGIRQSNQNPANFANSLSYAALVIKDRLPASEQHLIAKLEGYGTELRGRTDVPDAKRKEIGTFLRDNQILKRINLETFLKKNEAE